MSTSPGFFQSEAVRALLARARRAAGVPMSVHFSPKGQEGPLITSHGGCAACAHVASISGGSAACRKSRSGIGRRALRQSRPVTDVCHLGFGVLCVPVLPGEDYLLSLGPFVPVGSDIALEAQALEGLADLTGERLGAFPASLDDIHRTPIGAMTAMAEWIVEELRRLWAEVAPLPEASADTEEEGPVADGGARRATVGPLRGSDAQSLAAAIAGANRRRVAAIVRACADEATSVRRGADTATPLLALLTQTLSACRRAGLDPSPAARLLPDLTLALAKLTETEDQVDAVLRLLRELMRTRVLQQAGTLYDYRALDRLVEDSLPEGLPLEVVAAAIGKDPTAITHHLQRRFGVHYADYVARMRVDRARELFRRTRLNATAVAIRVGIDDQSNFTKVFQRHMGMSPGQYRARYGRKP